MDETIERTPVHLWIVGILSLLWNAFGGYNYWMSRSRNMEYLSGMSGVDANQMLAYMDGFPAWAQFGWGLGVWGAVLASVLLLMRSRYAVWAFGASLFGAALSVGFQLLGPPAPGAAAGVATAIVPYFIIAAAIIQFLYARAMQAQGVLR